MGRSDAGWGMRGRDLALGAVGGLLVAVLLSGGRGPMAQAQSSPTSGEASGTIAFTTSSTSGSPLLFLIDTREKAFGVYRVDAQKGSVKLEAARPYRYDLKLEYNNLPPEVAAVEAMVATTHKK